MAALPESLVAPSGASITLSAGIAAELRRQLDAAQATGDATSILPAGQRRRLSSKTLMLGAWWPWRRESDDSTSLNPCPGDARSDESHTQCMCSTTSAPDAMNGDSALGLKWRGFPTPKRPRQANGGDESGREGGSIRDGRYFTDSISPFLRKQPGVSPDDNEEDSPFRGWTQRYTARDPLCTDIRLAGVASDSLSSLSKIAAKADCGCSFPIIHPFSRARRDINMIISACIIFALVELPYSLCLSIHPSVPWLVLDTLISLVFIMDILLSFRTGFIQKGGWVIQSGVRIPLPPKVIMRPTRITSNYLQKWFIVDLVSSLPYDLLFSIFINRKGYHVISALRLLKILRVRRLNVAGMQLRETWTTAQMELYEIVWLLSVMLYFSHLVACLYILVARTEERGASWIDSTKYYHNGSLHSLVNAPPLILYICAFYFAMVSLVSVGYGDIHPSDSMRERLFITAVMLSSAIVLGYIVGKICSLVWHRSDRKNATRDRYRALHSFVAKEQLPEWLSVRMIVHLSQKWQTQIAHTFDEFELLNELTDELRSDLFVHWWRNHVSVRPLFPHKYGFLSMLLQRTTTEFVTEGDIITQEGEICRHLYIVKSGLVSILNRSKTKHKSGGEREEHLLGQLEHAIGDGLTRLEHGIESALNRAIHTTCQHPSSSRTKDPPPRETSSTAITNESREIVPTPPKQHPPRLPTPTHNQIRRDPERETNERCKAPRAKSIAKLESPQLSLKIGRLDDEDCEISIGGEKVSEARHSQQDYVDSSPGLWEGGGRGSPVWGRDHRRQNRRRSTDDDVPRGRGKKGWRSKSPASGLSGLFRKPEKELGMHQLVVSHNAGPGEIVGEAALVKALKRRSQVVDGWSEQRVPTISMDVTVQAKTECSILVLLVDDLFDLLEQFPMLLLNLQVELGLRALETGGSSPSVPASTPRMPAII